MLRHAVNPEQLHQHIDHIFAGNVPVHLQGQALPGILVYNREPLERGPSYLTNQKFESCELPLIHRRGLKFL